MIPNPWVILAFVLFAAACGAGGFHLRGELDAGAQAERDLTVAQKVIVRQEVLIREVPKIVERVVVQEKTVEKEVERVVTVIPHLLAPDCVLPEHYGELLVGAARGIAPDASGGIDATRGAYGCREVLDATLRDLEAGWKNSDRLTGLQEYVNKLP